MTPIATQRHQALRAANTIRCKRAAFRRELASLDRQQSRALLAALIEECPDWIASAPVAAVLQWPRSMGVVHAGKMLQCVGITQIRQLARLSERQRFELGGLLRKNGRGL